MSLIYQIVFPQDAPELEPLVRQLAAEWGPAITVEREAEHQLIVLQHDELLLLLSAHAEKESIELSFGEYYYQIDWYIELGKADGLASMRFYLELVGKLVVGFPNDFLSLFNGERVVLKREEGKLLLNTESGVWKKQDNLALLGESIYALATYPVNY